MPLRGAGVGDTNKIVPAHRGSLSNDKGTNMKHTWWEGECYDGGKQGDREEGSWSSQQEAGGGDAFLDADFLFCIFIFKKFWHLQFCGPIQSNVWILWLTFQHGQSFYTLSRLLILALLTWLDEIIPIDILWYCIPQEMHIRGKLSEPLWTKADLSTSFFWEGKHGFCSSVGSQPLCPSQLDRSGTGS